MLYMDGIGYSNDNMFVGDDFSRTDDMVAKIWNYMSCGVCFFGFNGLSLESIQLYVSVCEVKIVDCTLARWTDRGVVSNLNTHSKICVFLQ